MDYAELKKKTAEELRGMAAQHPELTGIATMKKEQLLTLLCQKLGIQKAKRHVVRPGAGKAALKKKVRELKALRGDALEKKDRQALRKIRRQLHRQKGLLRRVAG
jgi:hypothetical protein